MESFNKYLDASNYLVLSIFHFVLMNEIEREFIASLFTKLKAKPTFSVLEENEVSSNIPLKVEDISNKISNKQYVGFYDFVLDVRYLFMLHKEFVEKDTDKLLIISTLLRWFERKIQKAPHSTKDSIDIALGKQLHRLNEIEQILSVCSYKSSTSSENTEEVTQDYCDKPYFIQNLIERLSDIAQYEDVIKIFAKYNINILQSNKVSIPFEKIPEECRKDLYNYLYKKIL